MKRTEGRIFGYLYDGLLYCPLCFPDFGRVLPDEIVFRNSLDAHFGKCHRCGWPLWGLYQYENYLDRRKVAEKEFTISDDLSDLDKLILKGEIELISLRVFDADGLILGKTAVDLTYDEPTVSQEWIDKLLGIPAHSDSCDLAELS